MHSLAARAKRRSDIGRKLVAAGAIVAVTMLGNLRLQASELARSTMAGRVPLADASGAGQVPHGLMAAPSSSLLASMEDADGVPRDADDAAHLVPAIYAWDPDVRFVYFRHVSKWT